jgi:superfamily II helicase
MNAQYASPADCPCVDDRPACRDCGERYSVSRMHSQAADDSFICEDCATAQLEQAAGCNAGSE